MHDDADFLAAVAASPHDQLTRLVYADWLDERNDPRGELVRIEEEVRFEPAWSEVLWSQKPRRNELRAKCDPAWLAAMRYGTDCLPLFYGRPFPDHWRDGWRLIREATERWLGHPMPDVDGHAEEVAAVEKRLGLVLPPSMREFVAFFRDLPAGGSWKEGKVVNDTGYALSVLDEHQMLSVGSSQGGETEYGIRLEDLGSEMLLVETYVTFTARDVPSSVRPRAADSSWPRCELTRLVYDDLFSWHCLNYGRRIQQARDWPACSAWLATEFPYHTPHPNGDIYEGVGRSALLYPPTQVGLWSQSDPDGYLLPPELRWQPSDNDSLPFMERLELWRESNGKAVHEDLPF